MTPPSSIAHYRVVSKLGEGGMGAVYRATDTKLNRDVAIKILPDALANDPEYLARFTREAQVLAALNHPNIAAIYGIEERAIVMELVEGRDLPTPLPLDEALAVARQIADALEAAHERGIVHRDLKPANIKLTPDSTVKVLDFGLAKASDRSAANSTISPTLTIGVTQAGMIMGTAAYMAPEQAAGKPVDRRADIWSFGVVLYEMLTGARLFEGETVAHTLADVLRAEIDLARLPATTPPAVRDLLARCFDRNPRTRLRDIGEARVMLSRPITPAEKASPVVPSGRRGVPLWALSIPVAATLILGFSLWRATRPLERPLMHFSVELGPDAVRGSRTTVAISPDGTRIVYPVRGPNRETVLATRRLDQTKPTILPDTENGYDPFFSPDGQWIGFFNQQNLKKVSVQGSAPVNLLRLNGAPRGAAWGDDFIIANLDNNRLERIPVAGGKSEPLPVTPPQYHERTWRWPQLLPGGDLVLFTAAIGAGVGAGYDEANLAVLSLKTSKRTTVVPQAGYYGRYLPSGHLIYVREGTLFAVRFDLSSLKTRGTPVPILDDVASSAGQGSGQFDFSQTGAFVYLPGKPVMGAAPLVWMDAAGKTERVLVTTVAALWPALSPDGKRLAVTTGGNLLVADLERGTQTPIATGHMRRSAPAWAPDGKHIAFGQADESNHAIWWSRADGSEAAHKLFDSKSPIFVGSFSPDGRHLAFSMQDAKTGYDIWMLPLDLRDPAHPVAGKPEPFVRDADDQRNAAFSPDGRWIAYDDTAGGQSNVFVRPFPSNPAGGKWKISANLGRTPVWSRDGKQILYFGSERVMSVSYSIKGSNFEPAQIHPWSEAKILGLAGGRPFDIAPDGKRIICAPVFSDDGDVTGSLHVTLLLNFFDELKRRLP